MNKFEYTLSTLRDPNPYPNEDIPVVDVGDMERAGEILRQAIAEMFEVANNNPRRLAVAMGRVAGMSLEDIGARLGMTRQACHKHLNAMERQNARVGLVLRARYSQTEL